MIDNENGLPEGTLLTVQGRGQAIALDADFVEKVAVILLTGQKREEKQCWVVAVPSIWGTARFLQFLADVKKEGYVIVNKDKINEEALKNYYSHDRKIHSNINETGADSKVIEFFDQLVSSALKEEVSDIHIEKRAHGAEIKMRKHGELLPFKKDLTPDFAHKLCSVVFNVLAENRDIVFSATDYQPASINRVVDGISVKLRYQGMPIYPDGFDVVLRLLPLGKNEEFVPLEKLGYAPTQISMLMEVVARPAGVLVIAGTTGSGKSTTLKNLLMYIHAERGYRDKIYTVEDPPEYFIPRVSQIPVIRRKKEDGVVSASPFEDPINACMRGDPDIIMIGEVRDDATGDLLKKAVQSGHQVLTTVHAASALAIVERLHDFNLSSNVLGSQEFFSGLCYQKLVPLICPHCSEPLENVIKSASVSESDMMMYERLKSVCNFKTDTIKVRGKGCDKCGGIGVIGRTVCAEIIIPDLEMLDMFKNEESAKAHKYWKAMSDQTPDSLVMNGKSAMDHAMLKLRKGMISPKDVEAAFGYITPHSVISSVGALGDGN